MKIQALLQTTLPQVTRALLADYGLALEPGVPQLAQRAAIIGYSGDQMRGALGLAMTREVLDEAHCAVMGHPPSPQQADDLLAELSNQLLGRVKSALLDYGIEIYLSTPMVLRGVSLSVTSGGKPPLLIGNFQTPQGPIAVWLDAVYDVSMEAECAPDTERLREGDQVFF